MKLINLLFISCTFWCFGSHAATFKDDSPGTGLCNVKMIGTIQSGDLSLLIARAQEMKTCVKKNDGSFLLRTLTLDSTGGDVDEAMKIGRYLKQNEYQVKVTWFDCLSSCVLVLAGGVNRGVFFQGVGLKGGRVGIHRPFFADLADGLSRTDIAAKRNVLLQRMRSYLEEMDINPILADDMLSIPPESIKVLTEGELQRYRLNVDDANFEEQETAKEAKKYGVSSSEYRARDAKAKSVCKGAKNFDCELAIKYGISLAEYRRREESIPRICDSLIKAYDSSQTSSNEKLIMQCLNRVLRTGN